MTQTKLTGGYALTDEGIIDVPGLASRWVRLEDGRRAHYITAGDKGPPIVLLHGSIEGSSGTAGWRFMAPALAAAGFRVYCPDRPGYGIADTSRKEYVAHDLKAQVDFVRMFADALCLDKFHLGGNSGGCMISAAFAVTHPERLLSVCLIAGFIGDICEKSHVSAPIRGENRLPASSYIPPKDGKFNPTPDYVPPSWDGTEKMMEKLMMGIIYKKEAVWPEVVKMRADAGNRQREGRKRHGVEYNPFGESDPNMAQIFSTKGRLDKLTVPMIYLYGVADVLIPVENGFLQEDSAPNIQFFYPTRTGHQGQTDRPETFNKVAMEFFGNLKISWPTAVQAGVSLRRPINPKLVEEPSGGFPKSNPGIYSDPQSLDRGLKEMGLESSWG